MSLTMKKEKLKDPYRADKREGLDWMESLLRGGTPNMPTQATAGLTGTQQRIQAGVGDQYDSMNANYDTAQNYLSSIVAGDYDPRTSDYYKGLRQEGEDFKTESTNAIRQGANLGGMLQSTPRMAVESENVRKIDRNTLTQLGGMYENERNRMGQAAEGLGRLDANRIAQTGNLQAIADLERQIEQERNNAVYSQAMETITFPYMYQMQLANAMIGSSTPYMTGGGPKNWVSDTANIMGLAGSATKLAAGMPTSAPAPASTSGQVNSGQMAAMNQGAQNWMNP